MNTYDRRCEQIEIIMHNETLTNQEKVESIRDLIIDWYAPETEPDPEPPMVAKVNADIEQAYLMARLIAMQPRGMIN